MKYYIFYVVLAFCLIPQLSQADQLIINGGFENYIVTTGNPSPRPDTQYLPGPDWQFSGQLNLGMVWSIPTADSLLNAAYSISPESGDRSR